MEDDNLSQTEHNIITSNYQFPSQLKKEIEDTNQLLHVLADNTQFLNVVRRELFGEQLFQDQEGNKHWIQVDKPLFVTLDHNDKPLRVPCPIRNPDKTKNGIWVYVPNKDAINFVMHCLKFSGLNPVSPFTTLKEDEIREDLLEIESKVCIILANKRKKWGLDIAEYPQVLANIKTLIKDARNRALDGNSLKAIRTMTSRIERAVDNQNMKKGGLTGTFN